MTTNETKLAKENEHLKKKIEDIRINIEILHRYHKNYLALHEELVRRLQSLEIEIEEIYNYDKE